MAGAEGARRGLCATHGPGAAGRPAAALQAGRRPAQLQARRVSRPCAGAARPPPLPGAAPRGVPPRWPPPAALEPPLPPHPRNQSLTHPHPRVSGRKLVKRHMWLSLFTPFPDLPPDGEVRTAPAHPHPIPSYRRCRLPPPPPPPRWYHPRTQSLAHPPTDPSTCHPPVQTLTRKEDVCDEYTMLCKTKLHVYETHCRRCYGTGTMRTATPRGRRLLATCPCCQGMGAPPARPPACLPAAAAAAAAAAVAGKLRSWGQLTSSLLRPKVPPVPLPQPPYYTHLTQPKIKTQPASLTHPPS